MKRVFALLLFLLACATFSSASCLYFHSCSIRYEDGVYVVDYVCDGQNAGTASCPDNNPACNADGNGWNCIWYDYQDEKWVMDVYRCGQ